MANNHNNQNAHDQHVEGGHFIVPFPTLRNVAIALLFLTGLTVVCSRFHLGVWAGPVAFAIAIAKALLVMAFFMGLKYDVKGNRIIFSLGFFFLGLLFVITATDIWTRVFETSTL